LYFIGDIVFVTNYFYKRKRPGSNHMFVIMKKPDKKFKDYYGLIISSKYEKRHFNNVEILKNNSINHLDKNSIVYCDDLIKIEPNNIKRKIGQISADKYCRLVDKSKEFENLDSK